MNKQEVDCAQQPQVLRILHVIGRMNRGGAETMIMNIYRNIDKSKIQFCFVSFSEGHYDDEIKSLGGSIFYLKYPKLVGSLALTFRLINIIHKQGPFFAVHAHTLFNSGFALLAARLAGIKLRIAHSHNTQDTPTDSLIRKLYHGFMRILIKLNATCYLACGLEAGQYLFGRKFPSKGRVIPNAVEIEQFMTLDKDNIAVMRKEIGISGEQLTICQVARMVEAKNHKFSLRIAKALAEQGYDFQMLLVGEGILQERLEQLVTEYKLEGKVRFLGVRSDIPDLLQLCDVFLMPSLFEGLPVSLVEAQAAGMHCVVSDSITKEADLGLGLVNYLAIREPIDNWVEAICRTRIETKHSNQKIYDTLTLKGYNVQKSADVIAKVYLSSIT